MRSAILAVLLPLLASAAPAPLVEADDLVVHRFETTCDTYFVGDPAKKAFVVVDPGAGILPEIAKREKAGWKLAAVWITHGHWDHVSGLGEVRAEREVPVLAHPKAIEGIAEAANHWEEWGLDEHAPIPPVVPDGKLEDGGEAKVGGLVFTTLHVPGHEPGSLCYRLGDRLVLTGDVLFRGSVGRTDLETSEPEVFGKKLSEKLWDLPEKTLVLPGHGAETTIGDERKSNWLFEDLVRDARGLDPVPRPWLGVRIDEGHEGAGLGIAEVTPGSPAAAAGLATGDVLLAMGETRTDDLDALWAALRAAKVGERVELTIRRAGEERKLPLTFAARPR